MTSVHVVQTLRTAPERVRETGYPLVVRAFGGRSGLTLLLAALVLYVSLWRVTFFINDNYTVVNALAAVSDGHLDVRQTVYASAGGPNGLDTPGMVEAGGRTYGRNYGHVFAALPFLWLLDGLAQVVDLRVAIVGGWCLLILALFHLAGREYGHETTFAGVGSAVALGLFAANLVGVTPIDPRWHYLMAMQLVTMLAAAFTAVLLYRLLRDIHGVRVGFAAGAVTALASPVAFWAVVPKRHAITAFLFVAAMYALYYSRTVEEPWAGRTRALAYVPVGLTAWIHAPEGVVLLIAVATTDLVTAPRTDMRSAGLVTVALGLSLLPAFLTNLAIAGHPLYAPRLLPDYNGVVNGGTDGAATGGDSASGGSSGSTVSPDATRGGTGALGGMRQFFGRFQRSALALTNSEQLSDVFLRSGYIAGVTERSFGESVELTVLESAPILGLIFGSIVAVGRRIDLRLAPVRSRLESPRSTADVFAVVATLGVCALYLGNLPLHAQFTVRYLHPLYPLAIYAVFRLPAIRRVLTTHWSLSLWSYAGTVLVGTQLLVAWLFVTDAAYGESAQLYALIAFILGIAAGAWAVAASFDDRFDPVGAVLIGAAAGTGTAAILLIVFVFFPIESYVLPIAPNIVSG